MQPGETGLLAENRSGALASAMLDLLSNPDEAARMGERARTVAHTRYDSQRVAGHLLSVYDGAVGQEG